MSQDIMELRERIAELEAENLWLRLGPEEKKLLRQMIDNKRVSGLSKAQDDFARRQLADRELIAGIGLTWPSFLEKAQWFAGWIREHNPEI